MHYEKDKMLQDIMDKRGFVLDFHKVLLEEDLEFLKFSEELISTVYAKERTLERKVKELIFVETLTALRADKNHIATHIRLAVENGASKKEILEVLECIYPPCGTLSFMNGLEAFKETLLRSE